MRYDTGSKELYYFTSSRRYKDNITPIEIDTSKIYDLKPVSYTATNPIEGREGIREFGMIAEDTYEFIPEIVSWKDGHINSINYSQLPVLLLNEVQKHERKINGINNYLSLDDSGLLSLSTNNTPVVEQQNTFADYISFSNQIASFLKEVVFNVNAKFLASVKFVKQVTFGDEVKFSQDTVGRFVVPSGVLKVKVNFENEFTQVPTVYLSAQNQVEGGYNLEEINLDGFIVIFDIVQSEDVTFDWFAVLGSRTENATIQILEENTFSDQIEDVAGVSTQVTPEPISVPQTLIESTPTPTPELIIEVIQEASVEATISTNSAIVAQ